MMRMVSVPLDLMRNPLMGDLRCSYHQGHRVQRNRVLGDDVVAHSLRGCGIRGEVMVMNVVSRILGVVYCAIYLLICHIHFTHLLIPGSASSLSPEYQIIRTGCQFTMHQGPQDTSDSTGAASSSQLCLKLECATIAAIAAIHALSNRYCC